MKILFNTNPQTSGLANVKSTSKSIEASMRRKQKELDKKAKNENSRKQN